MATKSRLLSRLIEGDGNIKTTQLDSDAIGTSAAKSITAASGTTVYSSADTLPASADAGDQAFVSSTNRLYIYNGSGWYNIALVNTSPYFITSPNASYELSNTGAQTNIEILAVDSEGINITYSTVADSDFSTFATITKDSDNGRRFTITVDSDQSVGATGTVTFRASDGVNIASALSTFSVEFIVTNSNYTVLLLKADSDGTDNQVDASTIGRTLTEAGNVTSTAFTPYHPGGYSTYFDGTGDYLSVTYNSNLDLTQTSTATIEAWIYLPAVPSGNKAIITNRPIGVPNEGMDLRLTSSRTIQYYETGAGSVSGSTVIPLNTWTHVAVVKTGGNVYVYINGTLDNSGSFTNGSSGSNPTLIGRNGGSVADEYINAYIKDLRVVNGTAVYTSSFTPPTEPLTAITNTVLLACHLPYIAISGQTITIYGNTSTKRFGPYDYLGYTKAEYGGSVYFDGTGDWITTPADTTHLTMSGDFTIDFWIYPTSAYENDFIYGKWNNNSDGWAIFATTDWSSGNFGSLTFYYGNYGSNESATNIRTEKIKQNQWNHCRITRDNNVFYMAINGVVGTRSNYGANGLSWSDTRTFNANATIGIGGNTAGYSKGPGYMAELRVINGTALSRDSDFTPPTAPVTAVTNTKLLTCTNKHSIFDISAGARMSIGNNTRASADDVKFANTSAIYFDGTSDYLDIYPADIKYALGSKDFTIDMWVNFTATSQDTSYRRFFMADDGGNIANNFQLLVDVGGVYGSTGAVLVWAQDGSNSSSDIRSTTAINDGNWHHVAVSRTSNTVRLFVDGVRQGTNLTSWTHGFTTAVIPRLGSDATTTSGNYQGYIQDFRLLVGKSLYTSDSNITVPTAEFDG